MKKNLLLIIIGLIIGILITVTVMVFVYPKCKKCEKCEAVEGNSSNCDKESDKKEETIILTNDEREKYDSLLIIAKELYGESFYTNYTKQPNGLYVVTYSDIKELGYDISKYGNCSGETIAFYFDPDNVLSNNYSEIPVNINFNCNAN